MTDLEIREQIAEFTAGDLDAQELEDWLEDAAWDLGAEPTRTLAATVLRLLAEYGNGDWTLAELGDQLGALSRFYWFDQAPKTVLPDSVSTFTRHGQRSAATDRQRAAEFA